MSKLGAVLENAISCVDHNTVIRDLTNRVEMSGSYLLMIGFSCLVALLGLLTNSLAVVIGAMLISPLMGPIFTAALAFTLGDLRLARKTLKIIISSILLSVLTTALFTLISPLKTPTPEIISRTHPNIYDLLIAVFAGAAGAYALCTRVNYLFVTSGVAVATAVIPPLSVVGYGIGTGQAAIALGGFLLFFTNLVAIVISSDIVFYIFRFRASMVEEARYPLRRRVQILGAVLMLISVPLVYTLVVDIRKVNLTSQIERVLKKNLDRKDISRITDFSFNREDNGLSVSVSVNTVSFFDVATEKRVENDLKTVVNSPVQLDLEQVIVKSGGVEPKIPTPRIPLVVPPPQPETLAMLRVKSIGRVKAGCAELKAYIKPYPVTQYSVRFSDQGIPYTVEMTVARDYPFADEERRWLQVALEKKLGEPLALELKIVPLVPPMSFGEDGKLDEVSRKALAVLKQFADIGSKRHIVITAPGVSRANQDRNNSAVADIKAYLSTNLGIPANGIIRGPDSGSELRVTVEPAKQQGP